MKNNIKIAFLGNSKFSVFCLEEMKNLGQTPNIIITTPDRPMGRKMQLTKSETKIWAEQNNITFIQQEKLKDEAFLEKLKAYDLFIVASYGKIIPKVILDMPKYGVLNIHPSLLPKYRGPSPLQAQILNDEKEVGVTIMKLDEQVDHGSLVAQEKIILENILNFNDLEKMLAKAGANLFIKILPDWINGKIEAKPQNHDQATFTKKIEKSDGELDIINGDPYKNYLKFLAYSESPRVYSFAERNSQKIRFIITTANFTNDQFIIKKVIPEGKKEMNYEDFLRGLK
jgi:methionyl-tRNA formyltransferase